MIEGKGLPCTVHSFATPKLETLNFPRKSLKHRGLPEHPLGIYLQFTAVYWFASNRRQYVS